MKTPEEIQAEGLELIKRLSSAPTVDLYQAIGIAVDLGILLTEATVAARHFRDRGSK